MTINRRHLVALLLVAVAVVAFLAYREIRAARAPDPHQAILADLADLDRAAAQPLSPFTLGCLTLHRPAVAPAPVSASGPFSGPAWNQLAASTAYFDQRQYDETQVFLRQHPALDGYATWFNTQKHGVIPVCSQNLRSPQNIDAYLASRRP